ncbi:hypothetical protein vseg_021143 [Gypsophila vaccaria]
MSKKRNWFSFIKKLFFQDTHNSKHHHHKCKKRRRLFGRVKNTTKGLPTPGVEAVKTTLAAVTEDVVKKIGPEEGQHRRDVEVRKSITKCEKDLPECTDIATDETSNLLFDNVLNCRDQRQAALKIQTAYRGYLARKAMRALRGFVILQAIIRGHTVRRQALTTLKCLQSIVSIQSQICAKRSQLCQGTSTDLLSQDVQNDMPQIQLCENVRSDCGLLTKDEEIEIILRKREAFLRAQRIKAHSFNHRKSTDSEERDSDGRLRYWLKQYLNDQVAPKDEKIVGKPPKLRNTEHLHNNDAIHGPRKSLQNHRKQTYITEDGLHPSSPSNLPTYMAATKSAKAKTRSFGSPKLRPLHFDAYSDGDSPYKHKLSPMSSMNSEVTSCSFSKVSHKSCYSSSQQKSPSLKGVSGPVRSNKIVHDVRLNTI